MSPNEIIKYINENIDGRLCDDENCCVFLASAVYDAKGGNYLEIGSLFGGSAILASLVMKEHGYDGEVYAIDPFDGYYVGTKSDRGWLVGAEIDPLTNKEVTIERAQANAKKMGADVTFIKGKASKELIPRTLSFSVVYIDGDHWNDGPINDWSLVKDICTRFVIFDNCDHRHPAVNKACIEAWSDPEWSLSFKQASIAIFQREASV